MNTRTPADTTQNNRTAQPVIQAAGGILRGPNEHRDKIVVVRRRRYSGEIGLPKGKVKPGETTEATALREVEEETGYKVRIIDYAGTTRYLVGSTPKVVSYYIMEATSDGQVGHPDPEEIDGVELVTPRQAVSELTHQEDRDLVSAVFGLQGKHPP